MVSFRKKFSAVTEFILNHPYGGKKAFSDQCAAGGHPLNSAVFIIGLVTKTQYMATLNPVQFPHNA